MERKTCRKTYRQAGRQADTGRQTDRYTHIGIQTEGWPNGLRDRQT